jgi:hypothetical protein
LTAVDLFSNIFDEGGAIMSKRTVHYQAELSEECDDTVTYLMVKLGISRGAVIVRAIKLLKISADADGVLLEKGGETIRVKIGT